MSYLEIAIFFKSPFLENAGFEFTDSEGPMHLSVDGCRFLINGEKSDLWGIRVASASQTDELTDHLIAQLDEYLDHGVNAVTVFYQGSSGGCCDPFNEDGTEIETGHAHRMKRIVGECDRRGIVCIVGIFYQVRPVGGIEPVVHLHDWDACRNAVRAVTRSLKGHGNVILNIANEQNTTGHAGRPWEPVRAPEAIAECCALVHEEDPGRLCGGGGYNHTLNKTIYGLDQVDVLLFDTSSPEHSGEVCDSFTDGKAATKPLVNVELFGGWTKKQVEPMGYFDEREDKTFYRREVDLARHRPELSVFFHSNPWCQGPSLGGPTHYELGGMGTKDDPGMRWYFEYVRKAAGIQGTSRPEQKLSGPD